MAAPCLNGKQVRDTFLQYFIEKKNHVYVHSSPVIPADDPTLLFANAGMNQVVKLGHIYSCKTRILYSYDNTFAI